jgi:hypothetical protein
MCSSNFSYALINRKLEKLDEAPLFRYWIADSAGELSWRNGKEMRATNEANPTISPAYCLEEFSSFSKAWRSQRETSSFTTTRRYS